VNTLKNRKDDLIHEVIL